MIGSLGDAVHVFLLGASLWHALLDRGLDRGKGTEALWVEDAAALGLGACSGGSEAGDGTVSCISAALGGFVFMEETHQAAGMLN